MTIDPTLTGVLKASQDRLARLIAGAQTIEDLTFSLEEFRGRYTDLHIVFTATNPDGSDPRVRSLNIDTTPATAVVEAAIWAEIVERRDRWESLFNEFLCVVRDLPFFVDPEHSDREAEE